MVAAANSKCPICGRKVDAHADARGLPFCSPQCKLNDLGRWLDGSYRIAGSPLETESDAVSLGRSPASDRAPMGRSNEEDG